MFRFRSNKSAKKRTSKKQQQQPQAPRMPLQPPPPPPPPLPPATNYFHGTTTNDDLHNDKMNDGGGDDSCSSLDEDSLYTSTRSVEQQKVLAPPIIQRVTTRPVSPDDDHEEIYTDENNNNKSASHFSDDDDWSDEIQRRISAVSPRRLMLLDNKDGGDSSSFTYPADYYKKKQQQQHDTYVYDSQEAYGPVDLDDSIDFGNEKNQVVLIRAELMNQSSSPKQNRSKDRYSGPVDLDETVYDSSSMATEDYLAGQNVEAAFLGNKFVTGSISSFESSNHDHLEEQESFFLFHSGAEEPLYLEDEEEVILDNRYGNTHSRGMEVVPSSPMWTKPAIMASQQQPAPSSQPRTHRRHASLPPPSPNKIVPLTTAELQRHNLELSRSAHSLHHHHQGSNSSPGLMEWKLHQTREGSIGGSLRRPPQVQPQPPQSFPPVEVVPSHESGEKNQRDPTEDDDRRSEVSWQSSIETTDEHGIPAAAPIPRAPSTTSLPPRAPSTSQNNSTASPWRRFFSKGSKRRGSSSQASGSASVVSLEQEFHNSATPSPKPMESIEYNISIEATPPPPLPKKPPTIPVVGTAKSPAPPPPAAVNNRILHEQELERKWIQHQREEKAKLPSPAQMVLNPCISCHANVRSHIALPCLHMVMCQSCTFARKQCPVCFKAATFSKVLFE